MNNKKCNYCEKGLVNFTSFGSNNKAEVFIQELNILTFYGDDGASYYLQCNYCPFCGRKLSKKYVHNNKQDYSCRIRKNIKKTMSKEGLSIDELAKRTGIPQSEIEEYLMIRRIDLSAGKVGTIAEALAIPIEKLYEG